MAAVSISAYIDERDAMRVRMIAETEHCSVANFIANAVAVFSDLPKDLRASLLELKVDEDPMAFQRVTRELSALVARARFDMACQRLADQKLIPELSDDADDLELLDHASSLCRGVAPTPPNTPPR